MESADVDENADDAIADDVAFPRLRPRRLVLRKLLLVTAGVEDVALPRLAMQVSAT